MQDALSRVNTILSAMQNESMKWSNVYDKLNSLQTQASALNDNLTTVCTRLLSLCDIFV